MLRDVLHKRLPSNLRSQNGTHNKITIVGIGQVGMSTAFACVNQDLGDNITLMDRFGSKVEGEVKDLQHGLAFTHTDSITGGIDYKVSAGSKICIITAGARQREGETRLELLQRNVEILKSIVPELVKHSPDAILIVATNPVDILTYVTWKVSGLPINRVFGTGTNLDSARFQYFLAEKTGVSVHNVQGWIIGEHGDSSVPVWSGVNIAGIPFQNLWDNTDPEEIKDFLEEIRKKVVDSAYDVIKLKGYTSYAIALSIASICRNILHDEQRVFPLSTLVQGFIEAEEEVFLSVPCVLGKDGITDLVPLPLSDQERQLFHSSVQNIYKLQKDLQL